MYNCPICDIEFSKSRWNQIYCSKKCKGKSQNVNRILNCVICGTEFHNKGHSTTCSIECSKKNRTEYMKPYRQIPENKTKHQARKLTPKAKELSRIANRLRYQNRLDVREKISKHTKEQTTKFKLEV